MTARAAKPAKPARLPRPLARVLALYRYQLAAQNAVTCPRLQPRLHAAMCELERLGRVVRRNEGTDRWIWELPR